MIEFKNIITSCKTRIKINTFYHSEIEDPGDHDEAI
jgi:hypothetical protein